MHVHVHAHTHVHVHVHAHAHAHAPPWQAPRRSLRRRQDRTLKVWELPADGGDGGLVEKATLKGHKRGVWSAAFSPADLINST